MQQRNRILAFKICNKHNFIAGESKTLKYENIAINKLLYFTSGKKWKPKPANYKN